MRTLFVGILLALPAAAQSVKTLTLADALHIAEQQQPQLRQAHANTEVAIAHGDEARAPLLPQLNAFAGYERQTANSVIPPGTLTNNVGGGGLQGGATTQSINFNTYDYWGLNGLQVSQLIWDFNYTLGHWRSTVATAESQEATERATRLQIILGVETAYFAARANKGLVAVASETLKDQELHLQQVTGFVKSGRNPEIDLATARAAVANARVAKINAENTYAVSKAQLNQAMGSDDPDDFDVAEESFPIVDGEDGRPGELLKEALSTRPEFEALNKQVESTRLQLQSVTGGYWPSINVTTTAYYRGLAIDHQVPNWNAQLNFTWSIFSGLLTPAQVREQKANLDSLAAQLDGQRQAVRLQVEQARLAVRAAKSALESAQEALFNTKEQLRLANGRYTTGVGSIIELTDAQVAVTSSSAQQVQAEYNLATARAQLLQSLGRSLVVR
jgi:outer membrane protein